MNKLKVLDWVAFVLVIVGAVNWGLVGLFHFDLVAIVFGNTTLVSKVIYDIIGLAGIYMIFVVAKLRRE